MPKLAANLSMLFQEVPFLDRFAAAAACGFKGVEFLFPYEYSAEEIGARLKQHRLTQALFNLPPGDWAKGERGMAAIPGREEGETYVANLRRAADRAAKQGITLVIEPLNTRDMPGYFIATTGEAIAFI